MAEWSKAPDSRYYLASYIGSTYGNSGPRMRAWVQIPLLTDIFEENNLFLKRIIICRRSKKATPPGGLEPPTFRLTAERASRLRHGGS